MANVIKSISKENERKIMLGRIENKEAQAFFVEAKPLIKQGAEILQERIVEVSDWKHALKTMLRNPSAFRIALDKNKSQDWEVLFKKYKIQ